MKRNAIFCMQQLQLREFWNLSISLLSSFQGAYILFPFVGLMNRSRWKSLKPSIILNGSRIRNSSSVIHFAMNFTGVVEKQKIRSNNVVDCSYPTCTQAAAK